jgi:hypothetical protein
MARLAPVKIRQRPGIRIAIYHRAAFQSRFGRAAQIAVLEFERAGQFQPTGPVVHDGCRAYAHPTRRRVGEMLLAGHPFQVSPQAPKYLGRGFTAFEKHKVSFVAVTQQFNTSTSL